MYSNWFKKWALWGVFLGLSLATYPLTCLAMDCPTLHAQSSHACCGDSRQSNSSPVKLKAVCCQENQSKFEVDSTIKAETEINSAPIVSIAPIFLPPLTVSLMTISRNNFPPGTSSLSVNPILTI